MRKFSVLTILGLVLIAIVSQSKSNHISAEQPKVVAPALVTVPPTVQPALEDAVRRVEPKVGITEPVRAVQQSSVPAVVVDPRSLESRFLPYQALLTDNLGVAIPGPAVNLVFRIYDDSIGGLLVEGPINLVGVPINNGVVSVYIPVSAASFDSSDRWMSLAINGGAELPGRRQFGVSPYALRVDRVASAELDDNITLGNASTSGSLMIQNGAMAQPSISLNGPASQISTYGIDGLEQIRLWGGSWGELLLFDGQATNRNTVLLSAQSSTGGLLNLRDPSQVDAISLTGATGKAQAKDGFYAVATIGGIVEAKLTGGTGGNLRTYNSLGTIETVVIGSSASSGGFGQYKMANGSIGAIIDGDNGTNNGGRVSVNDGTNVETASMTGSTGRVVCKIVQINGADLAEKFPISGAKVEPGTVMEIDPEHSGLLRMAKGVYNQRVAGVVSGANDFPAGAILGHLPGNEDAPPIALSGRVWTYCDASEHAIGLGDLLTTSATAGHAMKAVDRDRSHGAIIGKAMSGLERGKKGLVLVLVNLQ